MTLNLPALLLLFLICGILPDLCCIFDKTLLMFHEGQFISLDKGRKLLIFYNYNWNSPWPQLGPCLFWSPRNLVPKKFGPWGIWAPPKLVPALKCYIIIYMQGPNFSGPKLLRAQISWGPNFSGTKFLGDQKVRGPNEFGDHFSHSLSCFFVCRYSLVSSLLVLCNSTQTDWFLLSMTTEARK